MVLALSLSKRLLLLLDFPTLSIQDTGEREAEPFHISAIFLANSGQVFSTLRVVMP
jgi:hypothetical protein